VSRLAKRPRSGLALTRRIRPRQSSRGGRHHQLGRSVCAAGQPAGTQVSWCTGLSGSDREFPALTGRSGTQRTRACFGEHLIRRSGHVVQDRPLRPVCWTDIPQLSAWDASYPAAWQQCWQQSRRPGADPRPSAFQAWRRPSCRRSCECCAPLPIAAASRWLLLLLSPLLSVAANPQRKLCEISLRVSSVRVDPDCLSR